VGLAAVANVTDKLVARAQPDGHGARSRLQLAGVSRPARTLTDHRALVVALAVALLGFGIAVPAVAADNTALRVELPGAPMRVHGSDGREHIDYDLVITNEFTSEVTLTSVTARRTGGSPAGRAHREHHRPANVAR
jgi:hypothetical protein